MKLDCEILVEYADEENKSSIFIAPAVRNTDNQGNITLEYFNCQEFSDPFPKQWEFNLGY
jgi:hypothetical protein